MLAIDWVVLILIVYYLFKVLVDWAAASGATAVVNNQQQQQQQPVISTANQQHNLAQVAAGIGSANHQNQQNVLLKPRNNRTPGEGTCYEIDNLALQDSSRYIPVRPIVRRNLLCESGGTESGEQHNTAVGVVIPTTPNSGLQTFRLNDTSATASNINNLLNNTGGQKHILNPYQQQQQYHHQQQQIHHQLPNLRASPLSSRVPDGASQNQLNLNKNSNQQQQQQQQQQHQFSSSGGAVGGINLSKANFDDKLNQIQEYIKLTTNLISSVQIDNLNGPRPQSVQSISTTHSTTPVQAASYDDLRFKMEHQTKNIQTLKDQQAHLLRLQQAARQQLQEMEAIRNQTVANATAPLENFESVEQVQDGISGIMERMRVLATFIQNQQELGNMLGGDNDDVLNEQMVLQQKFQELRDKKSQMHSLVSELQNLNVEASRHFESGASTSLERNVPIELTNVPATAAEVRKATKTFNQNNTDHTLLNGGAGGLSGSRGGSVTPKVENTVDGHEPVMNGDEDETETLNGTAEMLNEKINEINAMKSQLRRLKEMMDTVKLIEMKTGDEEVDEEEDAPEENDVIPESAEESRSPSVASQVSDHGGAIGGDGRPDKRREQLNQRVEVLHAMTRDLREQAKSIAAERDALKNARTEIQKRRNNVADLQHQAEAQTSEKLTNHVASFVSSLPPGPKEREQIALKAELEQKKRELDRIEKMTQNIKKNNDLSRRNAEDVAPPKVSSVSSAESLRSPSQPPVIPPPPAPSAVNNASASNATNHSKNSADSGVTDIFANVHLESGSYQSSSTRSLNMVPPMPDICNRPDRYRKSEDVGTSTARADRTSPWPAHLFAGAGPSSSNTGPQSPHFHPFVGSDIHVGSGYPTYPPYPTYANLLPPHTPNSAPPPPDPLMFQHFMQTQQMLMNSITQCNQLLWIQQREINNLNNAVLLLQERILNNGNNSILMNDAHMSGAAVHIRAESTPPNNSLSSTAPLAASHYNRARSEQPAMLQQGPSSPYQTIPPNIQQSSYSGMTGSNQFHSYTPSTSQQSTQFSINQQIQRNNTNISNANAASSNSSLRSYRNLRHVNINTTNNAIYEQQQLQPQSLYDHHVSLQQQHSNNFMNLNNPLQNGPASASDESNLQQQPSQSYNNASVSGGGSLGPSNMINNLANGPATSMQSSAMPPPPPQAVCLNNLNNSSNLNSNLAQQHQQTQALNNQVLPGVRANNYWDNFRR